MDWFCSWHNPLINHQCLSNCSDNYNRLESSELFRTGSCLSGAVGYAHRNDYCLSVVVSVEIRHKMDGWPSAFSGPISCFFQPSLFSLGTFQFNTIYIIAIDHSFQWLFSLASKSLYFHRTYQIYYQTFRSVALLGMLMAVKGAGLFMRLRWIILGLWALTLFQIAFRLCNVWISAFKIGWVVPVSQIVYAMCVYILPLIIALLFVTKLRIQQQTNMAMKRRRTA